MPTFADVVDAADKLSADEQESLLRTLRRRIAERNRPQLAGDVAEARAEFVSGGARLATAQQIMEEAERHHLRQSTTLTFLSVQREDGQCLL